jgi:hypothetical protein
VLRRLTVAILALGAAWTSVAPAGAATTAQTPSLAQTPAACSAASSSIITPVPPSRLARTEEEVRVLAGARFAGIGACGRDLLLLTLAPGSEATARRVRDRFGLSVQIMVGLTVWNGKPGRSPRCPPLPADAAAPQGFTATVDLDSSVVASGRDLRGHVVVRNTGTAALRVATVQPIEVQLVAPHTRRVVGTYAGAIAGTGYAPLLAPGQSQAIPIAAGTARCDGGVGSALPPGRYEAVGLLSGPAVTGSAPDLLTASAPVRVVAAGEEPPPAG